MSPLSHGDPYNPFRMFYGIFIPEWLCQARCISHGAKMVFGRLARYAGEFGVAEPAQAVLALECGMSDDSCYRYIKELADHELLAVQRRGLGRPNRYTFLWHDMIGAVRADADQRPVDGPAHDSGEPRIPPFTETESSEESSGKKTRKRGTGVPSEFKVTDEMKQWAREHTPDVKVAQQTHQFLDYHRAKGSVFKDWQAAWRTWMRKAAEYQGSANGNGREGKLSRLASA